MRRLIRHSAEAVKVKYKDFASTADICYIAGTKTAQPKG
jgi:hypothetical protein